MRPKCIYLILWTLWRVKTAFARNRARQDRRHRVCFGLAVQSTLRVLFAFFSDARAGQDSG
jgi:hypothetical protein